MVEHYYGWEQGGLRKNMWRMAIRFLQQKEEWMS